MVPHKISRFSTMFGIVLLFTMYVMGANAALFGWIFSTKKDEPQNKFSSKTRSKPSVLAPYDMDTLQMMSGGTRGKELYEKSLSLQKTPGSCWVEAYSSLASSCRDILRDETKKARMSLMLVDCFLRTSGRQTLPKCPKDWKVSKCLKGMDNHNHEIFAAFFIDCAAMCHFLQSEEFKLETETLVNELKIAAHYTEHKLGAVGQQMEEQHNAILKRSEHILTMQRDLQMEHALLQESIKGGFGELQEAANQAHEQLDVIKTFQKAIADKQKELATSLDTEFANLHEKSALLDSSMTNLHGSVDTLAEKSAAAQKEAMKGLSELQELQVEAMHETKSSMSSLAEQAKHHQNEFRGWQSELDEMHHRLVDGTSNMIKAQETFVTKQAAIFSTMEQLFFLHDTILVESRLMKTLMLYFALSIFIYMATTITQTQRARVLLYFGLFLTLTFEIWLIRFRMEQINHEKMRMSWPPKQVLWLRYSYGVFTIAYLIYCYFTYKDYNYLNYVMLRDIHGRFGRQSQLQERLLREYLARCELCEDLPQPNGHSNSSHKQARGQSSSTDNNQIYDDERVLKTEQSKRSEGLSQSKVLPNASPLLPRARRQASRLGQRSTFVR